MKEILIITIAFVLTGTLAIYKAAVYTALFLLGALNE